MKLIILASASPRRKKLLEQAGIKFIVDPSSYKEDLELNLQPHDYAKFLSLEKAKEVARKHKNSIIIAADTLVVLKDEIIGKPKSLKDAKSMLKKLSGKMHLVITGFTIINTELEKTIIDSIETKVYFSKLSDKQIEDYVNDFKPLDKAGGYGIQELSKEFIKKIEGDYDNVVGLPVKLVLKKLHQIADLES